MVVVLYSTKTPSSSTATTSTNTTKGGRCFLKTLKNFKVLEVDRSICYISI